MASPRKQPLYGQLFDVLRERIQDDLLPGDQLPSERQLSEQYDISRTTVRLALERLEERGLIVRRQGKGAFVADEDRSSTDLGLCYSFTEEMERLGKIPSAKILSFEEVGATKSVAKALGLSLGAPVYDIHRLRLADDVPMLVGHSYLPAELFPGLTRERVAGEALYDIIERDYGQTIASAVEEVRASSASADEAKELGIDERVPVLGITRITHSDEGRIIENTRSVARADKFKYRVVHTRT